MAEAEPAEAGGAPSSEAAYAERLQDERERVASVEQEWLAAGEEAWQELEGPADGGLRVFSSQELADRYNERVLATLPGKNISLSATDRGDAEVAAESVAPAKLKLRQGARVLCLKNVDARLRIGAVGHISTFDYRRDAAEQIVDVGIVVEFGAAAASADAPFSYTFATKVSEQNTFSELGASRVQLPLRLAYVTSAAQLQAEEGWRQRCDAMEMPEAPPSPPGAEEETPEAQETSQEAAQEAALEAVEAAEAVKAAEAKAAEVGKAKAPSGEDEEFADEDYGLGEGDDYLEAAAVADAAAVAPAVVVEAAVEAAVGAEAAVGVAAEAPAAAVEAPAAAVEAAEAPAVVAEAEVPATAAETAEAPAVAVEAVEAPVAVEEVKAEAEVAVAAAAVEAPALAVTEAEAAAAKPAEEPAAATAAEGAEAVRVLDFGQAEEVEESCAAMVTAAVEGALIVVEPTSVAAEAVGVEESWVEWQVRARAEAEVRAAALVKLRAVGEAARLAVKPVAKKKAKAGFGAPQGSKAVRSWVSGLVAAAAVTAVEELRAAAKVEVERKEAVKLERR